jgi:hypothetical protein
MKINGDIFYYTKVNDNIISSSLKMKFDEAYQIYQLIIKMEGKEQLDEILETKNINHG